MQIFLGLSEGRGWFSDRQYWGVGVDDVLGGKVRLDVGDVVLWVRRWGGRYMVNGMSDVRRVAFRYFPFTWDGVMRYDLWRGLGVDWWYIESIGELWWVVLVWERRKGWYRGADRLGEGDVWYEMGYILLDEVFSVEGSRKVERILLAGDLVPLEMLRNGGRIGDVVMRYYRREWKEMQRGLSSDIKELVKNQDILKTN